MTTQYQNETLLSSMLKNMTQTLLHALFQFPTSNLKNYIGEKVKWIQINFVMPQANGVACNETNSKNKNMKYIEEASKIDWKWRSVFPFICIHA